MFSCITNLLVVYLLNILIIRIITMKELTKAEEQIMQILWKMEKGFVKDIIAEMDEPKPAYNTVSTIVRILETKGVVSHEEFGKSHRYYPLVTKKEYTKFKMNDVVENYFGNSARTGRFLFHLES